MRVLIVDDEPLARMKLRRMLDLYDDVDVVGETDDGSDALSLANALGPDAVFLDIQMPGIDGFGVVASLPRPHPTIVFVTAYEQHALQAFDAGAADYLLKPVTAERLERTLQRLRAAMQGPSTRPVEVAPTRLIISNNGQATVLPCADVEWVESADNHVRVHARGQSFLMRRTLASLVGDLGPAFMRIHRTVAVSLGQVFAVCPDGKGDATVVLRGGKELPCSRQHRAELMRRLHQ